MIDDGTNPIIMNPEADTKKYFLLEKKEEEDDKYNSKEPPEYIWVDLNNIEKIVNPLKKSKKIVEGESLWSLDFEVDNPNGDPITYSSEKIWPVES